MDGSYFSSSPDSTQDLFSRTDSVTERERYGIVRFPNGAPQSFLIRDLGEVRMKRGVALASPDGLPGE
ncbi:hypothetical protein TNIN_444001 [Trichonephila inaurata madagascariensis]|uniref:Uncharacterized protein n=1 Tax=Trichonephila inaurata madagascariensis TaxID=2747483 RepID=A0A8X6J3G0_9ARAC|nr:hypothetical protein TNIN_444001 [Trichonephila inaurata madagascariensis]